ncbi:MAG: asparagine synthase (glutamine-hydrolyzing) [Candidatus Micrarchaeota archaeon]
MCGIAGMAGCSDKKLLKGMCNIITHRGPDHGSYFTDKNIALGYRRLSIIDLKGGNQPIFNEDGDTAIVFNGEIYNYKDLKGILEQRGHRFKTNSDTETIVHGYEEWGAEIANKLRGMFAFAIWDGKKRELLLARDKFGKKPLYYTIADGVFGFASEIKSLVLMPKFSKDLDYRAVDAFLAFRFIPSPRTIFRNVKKLQPGNHLIWKNGKIFTKKYWELHYAPENHSEHYFAKKVLAAAEEATRIRLMSEVPLGAYLSGGLDSSAVVALMAKNSESAVKTFSVGFGVEKYDELPYAKQVAEAFSTDHHELAVTPDSIKELPGIVWHLDEPMADPTAIPTYLLSKFAKRKVSVVLTGEGGDEVFAGYEQYKIMNIAYTYGLAVPKVVRRHIIPHAVKAVPKSVLDRFFKYSSALGKKGIERFSSFVADLDSPARSYLELVQIFSEKEREELYSSERIRSEDYTAYASKIFNHGIARNNLTSQMQLFDIATELPDDLLMKVDKMTMAASIEARAPLLDVPLAEIAFSIPAAMKLKGSNEKYIFRKAMAGVLPKTIAKRKKARFFVPIDYWFGGDLKHIAHELLLQPERKLFNKAAVSKILQNYSHSKAYAARQIWNLVSLELWMRTFIDQETPKRVPFERLIG